MAHYPSLLFSKAIDGYIIECKAGRVSPATARNYKKCLDVMCAFLGDPLLQSITRDDLIHFTTYLRTDYQPKRWNGDIAIIR